MAQKLEESLGERVRAEGARKELIASMSHDIRTPLTSIKAYVEGLQDGIARTEEDRQRYLEVIRKKTDELDMMLDQLFFLSKIDMGEQALPMEPVDLLEFLRNFAEESRLAHARDGMEIFMEGSCPAVIRGNRMLLERILSNLMTNSIKYRTGSRGKVCIRLSALKGKAVISFSDDGPGVPESSVSRLFELFLPYRCRTQSSAEWKRTGADYCGPGHGIDGRIGKGGKQDSPWIKNRIDISS